MSTPGRVPRTPSPNPVAPGLTVSPTTKFRAPRIRKGLVERAELRKHALTMALEHRLTLVCAPAGFGKSTLLAQLSGQHAAGNTSTTETVWLSIDEDDNDANRLFKGLLGALQGVTLEWDISPEVMAAQVDGMGPGTRASVAMLINTLCSYQGERLLIIVDDLHRIDDFSAMQMLDLLIDQLPPEVGFCIGSRVEPSLALARWRARGELGEIRVADLQFNATDTLAFAQSNGLTSASPEFVRNALSRTDGWAAGLTLLIDASTSAARSGSALASTPSGDRLARRNLFDFFAHEVLADLPPRLQDFMLSCSVLPELNPGLCNAVTAGDDAQQLLEELYRRNLFLTVLDEEDLTLRLHDLFREFLGAELARQKPDQVAELHMRAARAEVVPNRIVMHWLKAQCWDDALAEMMLCARHLLAEGGYATLQRWVAQLPDSVQRNRPEVAHLLGLCAWIHWDWLTVRVHMRRACDGYLARDQHDNYVQCLGLLAACLNGLGALEECREVLAQADRVNLTPTTRIPFDSCHAWNALARGEMADAVQWLHTTVRNAALVPETIYPDLIDLSTGHFTGLPNAMPALRELQTVCEQVRQGESSVRASAIAALGAWPEFWQGNHGAAGRALIAQQELQKRLPGAFAMQMSTHHLQAFHFLAEGKNAAARTEAAAMLEILNATHAGSLKASWERTYTAVLGRVLWCLQDAKRLTELVAQMTAQPATMAWPVVKMADALLYGQMHMLLGNLDLARDAMEHAVQLHARYRLPTFVGDPRTSLAMLHQQCGQLEVAWQTFAPVLDEARRDDTIGAWLVEPRERMSRLLALVPASLATEPDVQALLARQAQWQPAPGGPAQVPDASETATSDLSGREREVLVLLATGQSNKLIARALDLSPHTVKRHVANVLGKLGVVSRGEAAAWWRAHHPS